MFGLGSIIPIKTGLKVVATEIQNQLDFPVNQFDLIMKVAKDSIDFKVWKPDGTSEMYNYPQTLIKDAIKSIAEEQLTNNEKLDFVVIHFFDDVNKECYADIYFTDENNEQKKVKFTIE